MKYLNKRLVYINCWMGRCFPFLLSIFLLPLFIPLYSFLFFAVEMGVKKLGKTISWFHLFITAFHLPLSVLYVQLWKLIELGKMTHQLKSETFRVKDW